MVLVLTLLVVIVVLSPLDRVPCLVVSTARWTLVEVTTLPSTPLTKRRLPGLTLLFLVTTCDRTVPNVSVAITRNSMPRCCVLLLRLPLRT